MSIAPWRNCTSPASYHSVPIPPGSKQEHWQRDSLPHRFLRPAANIPPRFGKAAIQLHCIHSSRCAHFLPVVHLCFQLASVAVTCSHCLREAEDLQMGPGSVIEVVKHPSPQGSILLVGVRQMAGRLRSTLDLSVRQCADQ